MSNVRSLFSLSPESTRKNHRRRRAISRNFLIIIVILSALAPSAFARAQARVHVVQRGENLDSIAQEYQVDVSALMAMNNIANANVVYVGQQLLIPGDPGAGLYGTPVDQTPLPGQEGYYTVQRGDTLSQIAQRYDMAMADMMRLNGIDDPSEIHVGQRVRVTARVTPQTAVEEAHPQLAEQIYLVQSTDTLYAIAARFNTTTQALMAANGLPNANFIWSGQHLRIRSSEPVAQKALFAAGAPVDGKRWIEIDLSEQKLIAWQGDVAVLDTSISSGVDWFPTVTGHFNIQRKYEKQRMTGPGYDLPNVPWVMYFYRGYAIHGAYWHTNFGKPQSHGCINMRLDEAEMIYDWADIGTEVYVHE